MKTKILFTFLMTLAVVIGGWLYYDSELNRQSSPIDIPAGDLYVTASQDEMPNTHQVVVDDVELPKYKPSARSKSKSRAGTSDYGSLIQTPVKSNVNSSKQTVPLSGSTVYHVRVIEDNDRMYSSSSSSLLAHSTYGARGRVSSSGSGASDSYSASSTSVTALAAPRMLANTASFDPNHGGITNDNGDDPSDDFLPPVGAHVGEGFWILLILAGAYLFYRRKL